MIINDYEVSELDKQIILLTKNWFGLYFKENDIQVDEIEVIKYMIANYTGSEQECISLGDVYFYVCNLYSYLSDSKLFPKLSTKCLLDRFVRVLNPLLKTDKTQFEGLINTLLGGISITSKKGLEELGIELGEPDFRFLKGLEGGNNNDE